MPDSVRKQKVTCFWYSLCSYEGLNLFETIVITKKNKNKKTPISLDSLEMT